MNLRKKEKLKEKKKHLEKLQKWLNFDFQSNLYTLLLLIAILVTFLYGGLLILLLLIAGFIPILLKELIFLQKKEWLYALIAIMIVSFGFSWIPFKNSIIRTIFDYVPLLAFFGYCWYIKFKVGEQLMEINWELEEDNNTFEVE